MTNISRSKVQTLIESGCVFVNDVPVKDSNYNLKKYDKIDVDYIFLPDDLPLSADASVEFAILYEDADIIVVDKPAGVVVHPGAGNHEHTLVNGLIARYDLSEGSDKSRPGIVHRIDKGTSGILVVAKNDRAHALLSEQFQVHSIKRKYICFCYGIPRMKIGKIETKIARDPGNRLKMAVSGEKGKVAITNYRVLKSFSSFASKIECELHTGRTHQIRVHMSYIGHSLIGDSAYKRKNYAMPQEILKSVNEFPRQALHAYLLEFVHPITKKVMHFEAEMPDDLIELERMLNCLNNLNFV